MSKKVLIVDDDKASRTMLSYCVKRCGYDIIVAESGNEAIEILESEGCDLVLSDVMMGKGSGLELVSYMKTGHRKETPVLLISATISAEVINSGLVLGAEDYISKPINQEELKDRLERYLG